MSFAYVGTPILTAEHVRAALNRVPAVARPLLTQLLDGLAPPATVGGAPVGRDWFLADLTVRGHAGIGTVPIRLGLVPAPGITVITASNGAGKTSIAHAARQVLTDRKTSGDEILPDNLTGAGRQIDIGIVSGGRTAVLARRDATTTWTERGRSEPLPDWWTTAFERHVPVLLYPEVAGAIAHPKGLHDVLKSALDLDVLTRLQADVKVIRGEANEAERAVAAARALVPDLGRAAEIAEAIGGVRSPDADQRNRIYAALAADPLGQEQSPVLPAIEDAPADLVDAVAAARTAAADVVEGTHAVRDALLQLSADGNDALASARASDTCPACSASGRDWATFARSYADQLSAVLRASDSAQTRVEGLLAVLREVVPRLPQEVGDPAEQEWDQLREDWSDVRARCRAIRSGKSGVEEIRALLADLKKLIGRRNTLADRLDRERRTTDGHRAQVVQRVSDWLLIVEKNEAAVAAKAPANSLDQWLDAQIKGTREALFAPIAAGAVTLWQQLNPDSDLDVRSFKIAGGAKFGQVRSDVRAGAIAVPDDDALSVLSTGQRNALSLAVYFPRAARDISPFRFLVLDDPIQAFDGSRVRLLAKHLSDLSDRYQIIVLTHDERLWQEVRGVHPGARRIHLERSTIDGVPVVQVKEATSPGALLLADLATTLSAYRLGAPLQEPAVTALTLSCCRQALDAEVTTQIRVLGGRLQRTYEELRRELEDNSLTVKRLGLLDRCLQELGLPPLDRQRFADTVNALNQGSHGQAPPSGNAADRDRWQLETRRLIDLVIAAHGMTATA